MNFMCKKQKLKIFFEIQIRRQIARQTRQKLYVLLNILKNRSRSFEYSQLVHVPATINVNIENKKWNVYFDSFVHLIWFRCLIFFLQCVICRSHSNNIIALSQSVLIDCFLLLFRRKVEKMSCGSRKCFYRSMFTCSQINTIIDQLQFSFIAFDCVTALDSCTSWK